MLAVTAIRHLFNLFFVQLYISITHTHIYIYIIYIWTDIHPYFCTYIMHQEVVYNIYYIYIHTCTRTHTSTYIHIYIYMHITSICTHMCIFTYHTYMYTIAYTPMLHYFPQNSFCWALANSNIGICWNWDVRISWEACLGTVAPWCLIFCLPN